jgi:hypothetical protein
MRFFNNLFVVLLALTAPAIAAVTASGIVSDSATGALLNAVKIYCPSPICSTTSNSSGAFTLTIPSTEIVSSIAAPATMKIFYNPARNYFYSQDAEKIFVEVRNAKGETVNGDKLSSGNYFASCQYGAFKFLNVVGKDQVFSFSAGIRNGTTSGLAKTAAITSVIANFTLTGYNPATATLTVGQNNLVKMKAIPPSGSTVNVNIGIAPVDTLKSNITIP